MLFMADTTAGVQFIMDSLGSRPLTNLTLRVRPDSFNGFCTTLETAEVAATPVNLFAVGGGAFDFPDTFALLPGSIVYVIGRPDVQSATCAGLNASSIDKMPVSSKVRRSSSVSRYCKHEGSIVRSFLAHAAELTCCRGMLSGAYVACLRY